MTPTDVGQADNTEMALTRGIRVAERYFAAWNDHNPDAITAVFLEDGT